MRLSKINYFIKVLSIIALIGGNLLIISEKAFAAEAPKGNCSMTIYSNKNDFSNWADADGDCKNLVFGWYQASQNRFNITGMASFQVTHNGQQFVISTPASSKYRSHVLTVYTVLVETPKPAPTQPAPKPAPPQPAPKPAPTQPAPKPAPTQPAPKPAPTQPAPKPAPTQPAPKPAPTQPAPKPAPAQELGKEEVVLNEASKNDEKESETKSKVMKLLKDWLGNNDGVVIESEAKRLIDIGFKNLDIPADLVEELINDAEKLKGLILFFEQGEVKEVKELDDVRNQLLLIKQEDSVEKQDKGIEEGEKDSELGTNDSEEDKNDEGKKTGFIASVSKSISNFFKSIGSFFANLF